MSAVDLAAMLDAKPTGPDRWMALCPAHEDKNRSLSVRQTSDGVWLLNCFTGCDSLSVVNALGLEFSDLFPDKRIRRIEPKERPRLSPADALRALDHEVMVAAIIASDIRDRRTVDEETWDRLLTAAARISAARIACGVATR